MLNKTFETLQQTKVRLEACLEVDKELTKAQRGDINDIVELVTRILDEVTNEEYPA